jgi:hypothetical protein
VCVQEKMKDSGRERESERESERGREAEGGTEFERDEWRGSRSASERASVCDGVCVCELVNERVCV